MLKLTVAIILTSLFSLNAQAATLMTSHQVDQCIANKKRVQYQLKCIYTPGQADCVRDYTKFFSRYGTPKKSPRSSYKLDRKWAKKYASDSGVIKTVAVTLPLWALSWVVEIGGGARAGAGLMKIMGGRFKLGVKDVKKGGPLSAIGWALTFIGGKHLFNSGRLIGKCHNKKSIQWLDQFLEKYVANPSIKLLNKVGFSIDDYKAVANGKPLVYKDIKQCIKRSLPPSFVKKMIDGALTGAPNFERELRGLVNHSNPDKKMIAQTVFCDLLQATADEINSLVGKIQCIGNSQLKIDGNTFEIRNKTKLMQIKVNDGNATFEKVYGKTLGRQTIDLNSGRITFETLDGRRPAMWDRRSPVSVAKVLTAKAAILRCR